VWVASRDAERARRQGKFCEERMQDARKARMKVHTE
jgi:hypothetical protein